MLNELTASSIVSTLLRNCFEQALLYSVVIRANNIGVAILSKGTKVLNINENVCVQYESVQYQ